MLSSWDVRPTTMALAAVLAAAVITTGPVGALARGPIGRGGPDCDQARCEVAEQIAELCPCDAASRHRDHIKCVSHAARSLISVKRLHPACRSAVVGCAARSTCGTVDRAACWWIAANGVTRCRIFRSALTCEARGGTADVGSCCSACSTTSTTSTSTTSTSETATTQTSTTSMTSPTSTVTTTSTTTSTLLPCSGIFPACIGSCPPGTQCTAAIVGSPCSCVPTGP